jgi:flagellin
LNNIASLTAQNALAVTQMNLRQTLFQLSSGSRINSGADDAAGLAIADGLRANIVGLAQSAQNANSGIGSLQVADGSLAQVTNLLNRATTLATESANGTVSNSQRTAIQAEYAQITAEIDRIGAKTNYNGTQVFTSTQTGIFLSDSVSNSTINVGASALSSAGLGLVAGTVTLTTPAVKATGQINCSGTGPAAGDQIVIGATTYTFQSAVPGATGSATTGFVHQTGSATVAATNFANAINMTAGVAGTDYGSSGVGNATFTATAVGTTATITAITAGVAGNGATLTTTSVNSFVALTATSGGAAAVTTNPNLNNVLTTAVDAQATLGLINSAISSVASLRGTLGANINRLQAASNVISNQTQNLTAAEDGIRAADIPSVLANLSRFTILN